MDDPAGDWVAESLSTNRKHRITLERVRFGLPADIRDLPPKAVYNQCKCALLVPGDSIELQWRKSEKYNWSWFFGIVEDIDDVHISLWFPHYPDSSQFARAQLRRDDMEPVCVDKYGVHGGYVGGIRRLHGDEIIYWSNTLPSGCAEKINMPTSIELNQK